VVVKSKEAVLGQSRDHAMQSDSADIEVRYINQPTVMYIIYM